MRSITLLITFLAFTIITNAQTDTSHLLLWFQGRQIKPDVLMTGRGDTVRFDRANRTIAVSNKKTGMGRSAAMLNEIKNTPQRVREGIGRLSSLPKVVLPSVVDILESSYQEVQYEYTALLSAPITIPNDNSFPILSQGGKGTARELLIDGDAWDKAIEELDIEMKRLDASPLFTTVPKPIASPMEYAATCRNGDWYKSLWQKNFEFTNKMKADEDQLRLKALMLSYAASKNLSGDELKHVQTEVKSVLLFVNKRLQRKISQVLNTYGDDPQLARSMLLVVSLIQHEQETLLPDVPFNPAFTYQICGAMIKGIEKALEERDYPVALNVDLFLRTERYCKMVGYEIPNHESLRERFFRFNQFKLNLHIDAKARGEGGTIETELMGDNWFMAIPNKGTCRLDWVLIGPDIRQMNLDLIKNEMLAKVKIPYVGGKNWKTTIPRIVVDFNFRGAYDNEEMPGPTWKDSITIYPFYEKDYNELWQFPKPVGVTKVAMSNSVLLGCFLDIERLKEEKNKNPEDMQQQAAAMKKKLETEYAPIIAKYQSQNGKRAPVSAADFRELQRMQSTTRAMANSVQENLPGRYIFYPSSVADYEQVILEEKLDGKVLFPQNEATQFAWFKLKLEHDPAGKFNTYRATK